MELIWQGLIQAVVSGIVILWVTKSVEKNASESIRASEAEKKLVQRELEDMSDKLSQIEIKHETMTHIIQGIKERLILIDAKQADIQGRVSELVVAVERIKTQDNFGKVFQK